VGRYPQSRCYVGSRPVRCPGHRPTMWCSAYRPRDSRRTVEPGPRASTVHSPGQALHGRDRRARDLVTRRARRSRSGPPHCRSKAKPLPPATDPPCCCAPSSARGATGDVRIEPLVHVLGDRLAAWPGELEIDRAGSVSSPACTITPAPAGDGRRPESATSVNLRTEQSTRRALRLRRTGGVGPRVTTRPSVAGELDRNTSILVGRASGPVQHRSARWGAQSPHSTLGGRQPSTSPPRALP